MESRGLAALAESYALSRDELGRLRDIYLRLFGDLRVQLEALAAILITAPAQSPQMETLDGLRARLGADPFLAAIALDDNPVGIIALDGAGARALVDSMIGAKPPIRTGQPSEAAGQTKAPTTESALTPVETRILHSTVASAATRVFERAFGPVLCGRKSGRFSSAAHVLAMIAPAEQFLSAMAAATIEGTATSFICAVRTADLLANRERLGAAQPDDPSEPLKAKGGAGAILSAQLELRALMAGRAMQLAALADIKAGDVILLGCPVHPAPRVALNYQDRTLFHGTVVEDHGRLRFLIGDKTNDATRPNLVGD